MMQKHIFSILIAGMLSACATNPDGSKLKCGDESGMEYYNRAMFNFNYQLDKKVFKPVAKGYKAVTNQFVRDRVSNLFNNLEEPAYMINNVFQGEFKDGSIAAGRFVINSTLGLAGMFDVASNWGLEKKKAGFDGTLAKYCVPDGPFVVLPVLGPATPRYLVGWGADAAADPIFWALIDVDDEGVDAAVWGATALKYVNKRAESLELLDGLEEGSVDFYATMKSAFLQNRKKFKSLCAAPDEAENSYDFDFGYDDMDDDFEEDED